MDLRKYFDTVDHRHMKELLSCRAQDGVLTRLVGKWLKAGVWEKGRVSYPPSGAPQGGVISPLLSNIYLHEVLDKWFVEAVQPRCAGEAFLIRYADDFVMGFERKEDMEKVLRVIGKRFARYGLKMNEEKTRKARFKRPSRHKQDPEGKPETFDFLGFTLYWGRSRRGVAIPKVKTATKRFTRALAALKDWGWRNRHLPLREQQRQLNEKLRGHDAYYGVTHNARSLQLLRWELRKRWRRWLNRRNRQGGLNWTEFNHLVSRYPLARARVVHTVM